MTREEQIQQRRKQIPKKYQGVYDKALTRGNLRAAINAHCLECVAWVSDEIRKCTDLGCPLYVHRKVDGKYCALGTDCYGGEMQLESTNAA